jgi:hypothetical protein
MLIDNIQYIFQLHRHKDTQTHRHTDTDTDTDTHIARMHSSARRAGYPSDSSRPERQQTRTRPAGGGPPLYDCAVDRLRHLRHRSRPPCGRAVPLVALGPVPATATVPGSPQGLGSGAGDYSSPGGGPAAVTSSARRREPGSVPLGPLPVRGPEGR